MKTKTEKMRSLIDKSVASGNFYFSENQMYIGLSTPKFRENSQHKVLWMVTFLKGLYGEEASEATANAPAYVYHAHNALEWHLRGDDPISYHYSQVFGEN